MKPIAWSDPSEIKELMCGNKIIVTACATMGSGCPAHCGMYEPTEEENDIP